AIPLFSQIGPDISETWVGVYHAISASAIKKPFKERNEKSGGEFVAQADDGQNNLRIFGIFFQFLAQPGYVNIHGARGGHRFVTPNFLQQFIARNSRAAMLDQISQQLKLFSR